MKTVKVLYGTRTLGLFAHIRLAAIARSFEAEGWQLRWRRVHASKRNFGYRRTREVHHG